MRHLTLLVIAALAACKPDPPKPPPDPSAVPCSDYCGHLRELHCPQGEPTKKGGTCEEVCGLVEASGYVVNARRCSMAAASCPAVDACEQ